MNKLTEQQLQKIANPGENDIGGTQSPIVTQMAAELLDLRSWKKTAVMCTNELAAVSAENRKLRAELAAIKGEPCS
ncbi:hypothetical protein [Yersinia vastinensis]|uniref:hypothetical protein n=1 Tax=Yersinia vastinensis TaxID=2890318 RepID=UPI0011A21D0B|nr:hypothetical protein [Yersinia vastinensis]